MEGVMRRRFDLVRITLAAVAGGTLALALGELLLRHARSTPDVGPTAATLEEGFNLLFGAGVGLSAAGTLAAIVVRRGSSFASGLLAGVTSYLVFLTPYFFLTEPSDVDHAETVEFVLGFFFLWFVPFIVLGALLGWGARTVWTKLRHQSVPSTLL
jgi:hypothetical protein